VEHGVDLVLLAGALVHELHPARRGAGAPGSPRRAPTPRPRSHSPGAGPAGRRPMRSVLAPPRAAARTALGSASTTRPTWGPRMPAIASALAVDSMAIAASAPSPRAQCSRDAGVVATHPPEPTSPASAIPTSFAAKDERRRGGHDDIYGSVLAAHPGTSQGRPATNHGLAAHTTPRPVRPLASRSPCPGTWPATLSAPSAGPGLGSGGILMPLQPARPRLLLPAEFERLHTAATKPAAA
jgi:hypothetical protein